MNKQKVLNFGCGITNIKRKDATLYNLDYIRRKVNNFKLHNGNYTPYPYPSNMFDEIIMKDVLEHLALYNMKGENWIKIFKELNRILKVKGVLKIRCPHFASCSYVMEHHTYFSCGCFYMKFKNGGLEWLGKKGEIWLKLKKCKIIFPKFNKWIGYIFNINQRTQEVYEKYFSGIFKSTDIEVELQKYEKK